MNFEIHNEEIDHKLEAYDYILDETLIANKPSKVRHESRLMIVRDSSLEEDFTTNKYTKNLLDELRKGDLVVVNDTKVMKARLKVELENGRLIELLVLEQADESTWLCLARPAKKLKINIIWRNNIYALIWHEPPTNPQTNPNLSQVLYHNPLPSPSLTMAPRFLPSSSKSKGRAH